MPWLVCLALLMAVGFDPLEAFVDVEPFDGVEPRLSLPGAGVVALIVALRVAGWGVGRAGGVNPQP